MSRSNERYRGRFWLFVSAGWLILGILRLLRQDDTFELVIGVASIALGLIGLFLWVRANRSPAPDST